MIMYIRIIFVSHFAFGYAWNVLVNSNTKKLSLYHSNKSKKSYLTMDDEVLHCLVIESN